MHELVERARNDPRAPFAATLLVVVAAGIAWWRLGSDDSPAPPAMAATVASTTTSEPATVLVHVVGAVRAPGVVELDSGSRVTDALDAAGGPTAYADPSQLNLAAPIADGQRIAVPRIGEVVAPPPSSGAGLERVGPVNLNTATAAELDTLPGIGPALADAIMQARAERPFTSVDDLRRVRGIGDARFEQLRDLVTV